MLKIESAQNPTFKTLLSLTSSKGLKDTGLFLLSGEKLIDDFLKDPFLDISYEIVTSKLEPKTDSLGKNIEIIQLSSPLFNELDILGTGHNVLVMSQPKISHLNKSELNQYIPKGIEVVLPIGDPGNLGAIIRSCEAFGVSRALLTQEAAHPFLPKSVKASAGSVLRVSMIKTTSLSDFPAHCIALDMSGLPITSFKWPANGFLVVGEEGQGLGINKQKFSQLVSIPTQGVESLNAVVAASIALAHKSRIL